MQPVSATTNPRLTTQTSESRHNPQFTTQTSKLYHTNPQFTTQTPESRHKPPNHDTNFQLTTIVAGSIPYKPRNLGIKILHGCREIAFCLVGYFNLSHPVCRLPSSLSSPVVAFDSLQSVYYRLNASKSGPTRRS